MAAPTELTQSLSSAAWTASSDSNIRALTAWSAGRTCVAGRGLCRPPPGRAGPSRPRRGSRASARPPGWPPWPPPSPPPPWRRGCRRSRGRPGCRRPSRPASAPSGPSSTASRAFSSETQTKTASCPSAQALGVAARLAPFWTSASPFEAVRFQTVRSWPALRRLLAMGSPMVPRPMKPMRSRMTGLSSKVRTGPKSRSSMAGATGHPCRRSAPPPPGGEPSRPLPRPPAPSLRARTRARLAARRLVRRGTGSRVTDDMIWWWSAAA